MLEAMQEYKVTAVGKTFKLEAPFLVLATQNPVEQEGTYPLPEAQLDRFMFLIELDYPSEEEEIQIARTTTGDALPELNHLMHADEIIAHQNLVRRVPVPDHIYTYCRPVGASNTSKRWLRARLAKAARGLGSRSAGRPKPDFGSEGPGSTVGQLHGATGRCAGSRRSRSDSPVGHDIRCPG